MRTSLRFCSPASLFFLLALFASPQCLCASEGAPQAEGQGQTLEQLGTAIHSSLASLRERSRSLTEELQGQRAIAEEYRTKLSALTTSLDNTNRRLSDYETKLTAYEQKLRRQKKMLLAGAALVAAFVLIRIVTLVLRIKGIRLPEIANILL